MPAKAKGARRFQITDRGDIPNGRKGKHHEIVAAILSDLEKLESGKSLKIALSELPDSKVNIRSALTRATRNLQKTVATAADDDFLYVWNA
jgi:hypothetical protein